MTKKRTQKQRLFDRLNSGDELSIFDAMKMHISHLSSNMAGIEKDIAAGKLGSPSMKINRSVRKVDGVLVTFYRLERTTRYPQPNPSRCYRCS